MVNSNHVIDESFSPRICTYGNSALYSFGDPQESSAL